jgi:hypothetical protein
MVKMPRPLKCFRSLICAVFAIFLLTSALPAGAVPIIRQDATPLQVATPIVIVGSYGVGGTVSAIYPKDDPLISATFEWFADGAKIDSAQSSTIYLTSAQLRKRITAKITLRKAGFEDLSVNATGSTVFDSVATSSGSMSYYDETVKEPGCFMPRPSLVETPTVDWPIVFSCQPYNTNFGFPTQQKFTWFRNGKLIDNANLSSYRLQQEDAGKEIWGMFEATYPNGYVFSESKKLRSKIPFQQQLSRPTIFGSVKVGALLLARTLDWQKDAILSYQWFSDYAPVAGANSSSFIVRESDVGKAIQVMVTSVREGYTTASSLSAPAVGFKFAPANPYDAYSKVFNGYSKSTTVYDIKYISSPNVTQATLDREKLLVNRAADFWTNHYTPAGVTVVYLTKDDATWAEDLVAKNPSWKNNINGGIRSWIEKNSCGFALAFKAENKQVFIQCVRNGSDSNINDQQVGPHEYSHWVQYEQTPYLNVNTIPWLVEGQANFYGLALGIAPEDPNLKFVNYSLAGHATQYDIYNGYKFGDFKMLDILQRGNSFDTQIMLSKGGTVWDAYTTGTLVSEWLVSKFGHEKYVAWMKKLLVTKGQNNASERVANAYVFKEVFGFDYSQLGVYISPYMAARAGQLRAAWADKNKNQITRPTIDSTQQMPVFSAKKSALNPDQIEWLDLRLADGPVRQVTCTTYFGAKTTAKDLTLFKARAKAACNFANNKLTSLGRGPVTLVTAKKTTKTADLGTVWLAFKG